MAKVLLRGCSAQPLGSYLKSLAVLRLISEQVDPNCRGRWCGNHFELDSALDEEALTDFFLNRYEPTPVVAPWNGGSGFYEKDRKIGIEAIADAESPRFRKYALAIQSARGIVAEVGPKGDAKQEDARRAAILRLCRNRLPDSAVEWLDAAVSIDAEGKRAFAPVLGTGGNEGRLDYTNNFMENLAGLLIDPPKKKPVRALLRQALFGEATTGLENLAVGQYDPGRAGGFNQGQGIEAGIVANPWSLVLTIEGAVAWAGGIYRKQGVSYGSFLCSPFTVRPASAGIGSGSQKDQGTARAEIWTPLWEQPVTYGELRCVLREGRAALDGKPARNGLEFAESVASLGVDRGISRFVRYSLFKRRGDSYVATAAGEMNVEYRSGADLIRGLNPLVERADALARQSVKTDGPNSWSPLRRAVEEAQMQALLRPDGHVENLVAVLAATGRMHRWLLDRERTDLLYEGLSAAWLDAVWAKPEARIAAAIASIRRHPDSGAIIANLVRGSKNFAWSGRNLADKLLATLQRRVVDAGDSQTSPLRSAATVRPNDVMAFLEGTLDEELTEALIHAFVLVRQWGERPEERSESSVAVWPVYPLLKSMFLPDPVSRRGDDEVRIRHDNRALALLRSGRVAAAAEIAELRCRLAGLTPVSGRRMNAPDPIRLGAALLIPVWFSDEMRGAALAPRSKSMAMEGGV